MDLHILKYNNYFNRFFKRENSLSAYLAAASERHVITATNFNESDGVSTSHVVNFPTNQTPFEGDYAILADGDQIVSRWFILENQWIRRRQYVVTLRRDLVVDYLNYFKDSSMYIRKGVPAPANDPAIYNTEKIAFNQIKKGAYPITDAFNSQWIILYVEPYLGETPTIEEHMPVEGPVEYYYKWPTKAFKMPQFVEAHPEALPYQVTLHPELIAPCGAAPYAILAIPLFIKKNAEATRYRARYVVGGKTFIYDDRVSFEGYWSVVNEIIEQLGDRLYDAQLLPYSPFGDEYADSEYYSGANIPVSSGINLVNYKEAEQEAPEVEILPIIACTSDHSTHQTILPNPTTPSNISTNLLKKIVDQMYLFRITDAFGGSIFEYNVAKNNMEYRCIIEQTLKPFQPLVFVRPVYSQSGLYGSSDEEKRGMISRGPYTLPRMSDAWVNYAQNNINYQKSFNRSIESLEFSHALQRVGGLTQMVGGASSAAITGLAIGGPAGAAVSGAASLAGGVADFAMSSLAMSEAVDRAKDQFEYQLGNIKARPDCIASLSVFDAISSKAPVFEWYCASDSEIEWFKAHLRMHGCTIDRIGTFAEAVTNVLQNTNDISRFVQGTLLRCNVPDPHMANELASELMKGVYVYVDTITN